MIRRLIFVFITLIVFSDIQAQVPQKIIVEHFTNTRCGICTSRNPAFYEVYNNNPEVLHISYHPSRPYASCVLYQHNKTENDERTKYYNVYGSTPKFVIQGKLNNSYSQLNVYDPYKDKLSDFSIALTQYLDEAGEINITVKVNNETGVNVENVNLYLGMAESIVYYDAPNGEKEHYDVFRKAFTPASGESINLNGSYEVSFKAEAHQDWDLSQMFVFAILQDASSKTIIQAEAADAGIETVLNIDNYYFETSTFYPNPSSSFLHSTINFDELAIYNNNGQLMRNFKTKANNKFDISSLNNGLYLVKATNGEKTIIQKILKK